MSPERPCQRAVQKESCGQIKAVMRKLKRGPSREDGAGFEKGQELFGRLSRLLTASRSPWQRLKTVNKLWDWLEVWGNVFPQSPLIPGLLRRELQRVMEEIGPMFELIPGRPDAVDRLLPLLGSAPVLGQLQDELLSPPAPARLEEEPKPAHVPGWLEEEPLPSAVPGWDELKAELPSLPDPVPVLEELKAELPPMPGPVPVLEELKAELPPLPGPDLEEVKAKLPPSADLQGSAADLHGFAKGSSGFLHHSP
ncbi:hypothetical protein CRENBAI_014343 [Crenichthys baileyi]|uniref:Uncharacterized protein n=1 Tax=Crenichthys baileyi TaxID=28760 RepID=A0AAV9S5J1_9TELE